MYELPEDFTAKIGKPLTTSNTAYDKFLRKFLYSKALENVLNTNNTVTIISLIEELLIR